MSTPIEAALADLRARRDQLNAAISVLEGIFGAPAVALERPSSEPAPSKVSAPRSRAAADSDHEAAILAKLQGRGWMRPMDLAQALGISIPLLRYRMRLLVAGKKVLAVGTTGGRRFALAGTPPAKEAP